MSDMTPEDMRLRVAELPKGRIFRFDLQPDAETLHTLARDLEARSIRKLTFAGALHPEGRRDWRLKARLGATVLQDCVVTLAPVTTRIDQDVTRHFAAEASRLPQADETEIPEDDSLEPLGEVIDLRAVLVEALALALPDYPRAEGAELDEAVFAPDGVEPLQDDDLKPFAGLAALKEKLEKPD